MFKGAVHLIDTGAVSPLAQLLREHPGLIRERVHFEGGNYFRDPALLDFIAENPMRHGVLPGNIVQIAEVLLKAGPDQRSLNETLGLIASGCVPRECTVQHSLIELLCNYGAEPNTALHTAILHGEFEAVRQLVQCGAKSDLPVLAGLGETRAVLQQLSGANPVQRHLALELAARYGHIDIVSTLLDAGVDPNRYSIGHSHSTALHQAALAGHMDTVILLNERGAKGDLRDTQWNGTAADWAAHAGHTAIADFLREQQRRQT